MREQLDGVVLDGTILRVHARAPLPADTPTVAVATAIRVFERFPVIHAIGLVVGETETRLTRGEVEELLRPDGFAGLRERGRWHQILSRAVQAYTRGAR